MRLYFIKTPRIVKKLFSNYTWCFASKEKEVYLTFDDGPTDKITDFVLNELKKYNAKATFFCIGKNIENHPEIFDRIIIEGHSIGNHTQNHFNGWRHSLKDYIKNVEECEKVISNRVNLSYKLFRPPYGKIKPSQGKKIIEKGYKIIMWDVLSADFEKRLSKEKCLKNVLKNTKKGSVIVFHDSVKASERLCYTLPIVLKKLSEKGYKFKAIT